MCESHGRPWILEYGICHAKDSGHQSLELWIWLSTYSILVLGHWLFRLMDEHDGFPVANVCLHCIMQWTFVLSQIWLWSQIHSEQSHEKVFYNCWKNLFKEKDISNTSSSLSHGIIWRLVEGTVTDESSIFSSDNVSRLVWTLEVRTLLQIQSLIIVYFRTSVELISRWIYCRIRNLKNLCDTCPPSDLYTKDNALEVRGQGSGSSCTSYRGKKLHISLYFRFLFLQKRSDNCCLPTLWG